MSQHIYQDPRHTLHELVEVALLRSRFPVGPSLNVEMAEGAVVIRGTVHSYYQKQLAQESIRQLCGTRRIHNELRVVPLEPAIA